MPQSAAKCCKVPRSATVRGICRFYRQLLSRPAFIIGDSNTYNLKFGEGQGTFGHNIPGKRVAAFTIEDINPHDCCGYKNIFIHTGINDIKQDSVTGPSKVTACFNKLVRKVNEIKTICPKSRLYISPILPTKDQALNQRCLYFNKLLFDFVRKSVGSVLSHDFSDFCDQNGLLSCEMGRFDKPYDKLHLGKPGIRLLVKIIRDCVYGNVGKPTRSSITGKSYSKAAIGSGKVGGVK